MTKKTKKTTNVKNLLKVCIFSRDEKIELQFLKNIKAKDLFSSKVKLEIGIDFTVVSYQGKEKYVFQFWSISNKNCHKIMIPNFFFGSGGIIYFYQINDKIEESRLKLVKEDASSRIPILFVGYDTILPQKPEQSDHNIPIIQKYFGDFDSLYISVDKPDSMFQILDEIIRLDTSK
jgi:hypothetical protein